MPKDLLFEIGTEEMPALFMNGALDNLKELAEKALEEQRLGYETVQVMGTPRRLALIIKNLSEKQAEVTREVRGPRYDKAFDKKGNPTKAVEGFARAQGVEIKDLVRREVSGAEYVFAVLKDKGKPAGDILPEMLQSIVLNLSFPKSMRWGYSTVRFARPIRWLAALFGSDIIPLQIENVKASRATFGHRFLHPEPVELEEPGQYIEKLRQAYVIVDQRERRTLIEEQVRAAAREAGGEALIDPELLDEVNFLVEYPTAFTGQFKPEYLELPPEVLITTMKEHQRYFPVVDGKGKLLPCFVGVRNGTADNIDIVREGNQRVLKARLDDAHFFYQEDTSEPLENKVKILKNVVYQQRLGTVWAKVERLQKLSVYLAEQLDFRNKNKVKRAAYLCKADLETSMVYEFPELQGVMGRYYALHDGEDQAVADGIFEHYLPRFAGDELPSTEPGIACSLAEKLDNLVGNFAIGVKPTGSQDPFALRRQALGIVAIILGRELELDLEAAIRESYRTFKGVKLDLSEDELVNELMDFILQRLRGVLINDEKMPYDAVGAVLDNPARAGGNLLILREKIRALVEARQHPDFEDFITVFNRVFNLSRKGQGGTVDPQLFEDKAETDLYNAFRIVRPEVQQALKRRRYDQYFEAIATLRPVVDFYFDKVMVMVEDEKLRQNRLALLNEMVKMFLEYADFSQLV